MKEGKEQINTLIAQIDNDLLAMKNIEDKIEELYSTMDKDNIKDKDNAALGYYLHNLYNAVESILKRLSIFFENSIQGDTWHTDLLKRMALEIPEVRPTVISNKTYVMLNELRKFRHIFCHAYDYELRFKRMDELWKEYLENKDYFLKDMNRINQVLKDMR
ncbi:MAG: hypothetical protein AB1414_01375 [bacterium]